MVKVFEGYDCEYYMDGYLKSNLDIAKSVNKDDWDFLFIIDGKERGGKSVLAQQIGFYLNPNGFGLSSIVFTPTQFEDAVRGAGVGDVVIYDEAFGGLNSRSFMSKVNRSIVKMLTEIGFKNLFIIIVLPSFMDLDRYVALWRSRALFHIYTSDNLERGYFSAYNEDTKRKLYVFGRKEYDYKVVKSNFYGRFSNKWLVNKDDYVKKKRDAQFEPEAKDELELKDSEVKDLVFRYLMLNDGISDADKIRALGITPQYFYLKKKAYLSSVE